MSPLTRRVAALCAALAALWAGAADPVPAVAVIRDALPAPLRQISPGATTRARVREYLGKPAKSEGDADFYVLDGIRYDTTVQYSGDVVRYVRFSPASPVTRFRDLGTWITNRQLRAIDREAKTVRPDHDTGRTFTVGFPELGYELKFHNTPDAYLMSVLVHRPEKPR